MDSFIKENFFPEVINIYHYCSKDIFMKIVKNRELWLTNISKMNDFAEEKWAGRLIRDAYNELLKITQTPHMKAELFTRLYDDILSLYPKFACCLSESPDILSQWRTYADDGKGFSIGFATQHLDIKKEAPRLSHPSEPVSCYLIKVLYSCAKQCEFIKYCIKKADATLEPVGYGGVEALADFAVAIKNPAFSEEKEWRIVLPNNVLERDKGLQGHPSSELFFDDTSKVLAPHFIHKFNPKALVEVKLGSKNIAYTQDVELFLQKYGFQHVKVSTSDATYR